MRQAAVLVQRVWWRGVGGSARGVREPTPHGRGVVRVVASHWGAANVRVRVCRWVKVTGVVLVVEKLLLLWRRWRWVPSRALPRM